MEGGGSEMNMREIKFRGKDNQGNWVYGSLVRMNGEVLILPENATEVTHYVFIASKTIGQFTGLKDKNGKEIWEGDVLYLGATTKGEKIYSKVYWSDNQSCFRFKVNMLVLLSEHQLKPENCRVVGNIFETPTLWKQED